MITLEANKKNVKIPDRWHELTREQYLSVISIIESVSSGNLSFFDAKLKILQALSGYKRSRKRFSTDDTEQINSNLLILSEMIRFVFRPEYPEPEVLEVFTPDLQELLHDRFPFEIYDKHHTDQLAMVGDKLKYSISLNLDMRTNPISNIGRYKGPQFDIDKNMLLTTDFVAEEYIDALSYYKLYHQTNEITYLDSLLAMMYRQERSEYKTIDAQRNIKAFCPLDTSIKKGVFYFFQAVQEYLMKRSPYSILYGTPAGNDNKISLGMIETLYSLSKDGYGGKEELGRMNLLDFLNLQIKQLKDAVASLRGMKKKPHEIAQTLKLPIDTIIRL